MNIDVKLYIDILSKANDCTIFISFSVSINSDDRLRLESRLSRELRRQKLYLFGSGYLFYLQVW